MSCLNQVFLRDSLKRAVFFKPIMHSRLRDEQQRKQFSQEQKLQEAKAREGKDLARQNQEHKQKEQQTQLEKEVRAHDNLPVPHVGICFALLIFQYCDVTVNYIYCLSCFFFH